jgi:hypothetical protein
VELRRDLLDRLGLFGVRFALRELQAGRVTTAGELAGSLVGISGFGALRRLIDEHFLPRSQVLKARSALISLRAIAARLAAIDPSASSSLAAEVERCEASTLDFAHLRLAHLARTGEIPFGEEEANELERVLAPGSVTSRLGLGDDASVELLRSEVVLHLERWRTRGAEPMAGTALFEACETMARTYEALYVEAGEAVGATP